VRARLLNQQLVRPRFRTPDELVRWMGAVQCQDYLGGLWAVGQRLPGFAEADVEAAIAARTIVRSWPMRGTLHFVPAEDLRWMLPLLTPRVLALSAGRYRELELDETAFRRSRTVLERALRVKPSLTRPEAYAALERGGVSPAGQRGIHILSHLSQQGLLCFGPRQGRQPTFVLLDEWVPSARPVSREQALATLATRYFTSHGPATLRDFAWWTGLLAKDAQAAIAAAGKALVEETREGRRVYRGAAAPASKAWRAPVAALLPPWDEYVVAYQDRSAVEEGFDVSNRMKTVGSPLLVIDGRARGFWKRTLTAQAVRVTLELPAPLSAPERAAVEKATLRYARFLGKVLQAAP
jgi:hypothetical protein